MPKNSKKNLMPKMGEIAIFVLKITIFLCLKYIFGYFYNLEKRTFNLHPTH